MRGGEKMDLKTALEQLAKAAIAFMAVVVLIALVLSKCS
jgi:hypothetical protein